MKDIPLKAQPDHLAGYMKARNPVAAVSELVWNSLDADATSVAVTLNRNGLDSLTGIVVADNGDGIPHDEAELAFGNLGGSWKKARGRTKQNRTMHGRHGRGRFRAFALGSRVEWQTAYAHNGGLLTYSVVGSRIGPSVFRADDAPRKDAAFSKGTTVTVSGIEGDFRSLDKDRAVASLTEELAIYLTEYPGINVSYEGEAITPSTVIRVKRDLGIEGVIVADGKKVDATLTVVEWTFEPEKRRLYLCDPRGVALAEVQPGIHAPGFRFTAYLKCEYLNELATGSDHQLELGELNPGVKALIDAAKDRLRDYFRERAAEEGAVMVKQWKDEKIYPYEGEAVNPLESVERQVFDVCAVNVNAHLKDFENGNAENKRFTFTLLRQAISENPESLQRIIQEALKLPKEAQDDLAALLQKTSLTAIIEAAKEVTDRLNFIQGFRDLVFGEDKNRFKERSQLHRMLVGKTWLFGEQYHLTVDDEGLTTALQRHLKILGREELAPNPPVTNVDGSKGILDLMLSRRIEHIPGRDVEHLVVELKRPTQKITEDVLNQTRKYALAVGADERFRTVESVHWTFIAVSNDFDKEGQMLMKQMGMKPSVYWESDDGKIVVKAMTWGQILEQASARLSFYSEKLKYSADLVTAKEYLTKTHAKYLPSSIVKNSGGGEDEGIEKKKGKRKPRKPKL
jgi:hypothetical protein